MSGDGKSKAKNDGPVAAKRPHVLTVILSSVAIVVSGFSFYESREATKIARQKAEPLVYSTDVDLRRPLTARSPIYVAVKFRNYGETPALNIATIYNLQLVPEGTKLFQDLNNGTQDSYTEEILASQDWTQVNYQSPKTPSQQDVANIARGQLILFFYGKTDYVAGEQHKSYRWCWRYNPDLKEFWRCIPSEVQQSNSPPPP